MEQDSFAHRVREELAHRWPKQAKEQQAELAGLVVACCLLPRHMQVGEWEFHTENAAVARLILNLLRSCGESSGRFAVRFQRRLRRGNIYVVYASTPGPWQPRPGQTAPTGLGRSPVRRRAFLRGLWLGAGSVSDPGRTHHLEFQLVSPVTAQHVAKLLAADGFPARVAQRRGNHIVYLKDSQAIVDLLATLGAQEAVLDYQDALVMHQVRSDVNRLVNAETANIGKAIDAGLRQVLRLEELENSYGLSRLPANLQAVARMRLEYPELSLRELGQRLDPPLTKSSVAYRLRRIEKLAEEWRAVPEGGQAGAGQVR